MLKKIIFLTIFCIAGAVAAPVLSAQTGIQMVEFDKKKKKKKKKKKSKKEEEKEKKPFKDHLWYGAGVGLGFSGYGGQSAFGIGVSPMVGYKVIDRWLSVGPRASVFFTSQKFPGYKSTGMVDTELGAFARLHAFRGFFIQGEMGYGWDQEIDEFGDFTGTKLPKKTTSALNPYVGIGYNFGQGLGGPGQEISLMYNFRIANDINTNDQPVQYRIAFTFGF